MATNGRGVGMPYALRDALGASLRAGKKIGRNLQGQVDSRAE